MTKEQFKKAINDRESQIKNLKRDVDELRKTYIIEHAKFSIGEKVTVIENTWDGSFKQSHTAFISDAKVNYGGDINYSFVKCKKDGTRSSIKLYVSNYEVKKLNSEPTVEVSDTTDGDSSNQS